LEEAAEHGAQRGVKIKKTWDSADGYDLSLVRLIRRTGIGTQGALIQTKSNDGLGLRRPSVLRQPIVPAT
jgi:hypothetical protein